MSADAKATETSPSPPPAGLPHSRGHGAHGPIHTHCENCGSKLHGPYCADCGQHDFPFHAAFGHVLQEVLESFFHFEGKFFRNVLTLLFRPGELTAAFNGGRRASQMPPFRLYLFVSVLFFVAFMAGSANAPTKASFDLDDSPKNEEAAATRKKGPPAASPDAAAVAEAARELQQDLKGTIVLPSAAGDPKKHSPRAEAASERIQQLMKPMLRAEFRERMVEHFRHAMPRLLLIALPLFALYTRVLFRGAGQVYLQHLVIALHFHTFVYLWMMLRDGWSGLAALASPAAGSAIETLCSLWLTIYPFWMLRRLFANGWWMTIAKGAVLTVVYSLTLSLIFLGGFVFLLVYG